MSENKATIEDDQNKIADLENVVHKDKFEKLQRRVDKLEEIVMSVKEESSK